MVRYELDLDNPPPLTAEQVTMLNAADAMRDEDIDFSDIPKLDDTFFENAIRGSLFRPVKKQVTLRLDAGILDWFKRRNPRGYQTAINKALLDHIFAVQREARKKAG